MATDAASLLRTSSLNLVFFATEYCCPVWLICAHVSKTNEQLNLSLRTNTGTMSYIQSFLILLSLTFAH